jgi:hypothetical protein
MQPTWVKNGIAQLIRQFCQTGGGNAAWIGISGFSDFSGKFPSLQRFGYGFADMPPMERAEGFVWRPNSLQDQPELWLSPTKRGYRKAFERFAQQFLGAPALTDSVQIDHVFPKKAGILGGLSHVRMLAIPPASNMAAGRTLERAMVARNEDLVGPRGKRTRMATYFAIGKAAGFVDYEQMPDDHHSVPNAALAASLMRHLRIFGLPQDVLTPLDEKLTGKRAATLR